MSVLVIGQHHLCVSVIGETAILLFLLLLLSSPCHIIFFKLFAEISCAFKHLEKIDHVIFPLFVIENLSLCVPVALFHLDYA